MSNDNNNNPTPTEFVTVWGGWPDSLALSGNTSTLTPVVTACSPGPQCSDQWVRCQGGTNIDVTDLISKVGGGSLALTALSTGFTQVPESCKRNDPSSASGLKYSVFMRYTLTPDHAQPTAQPTAIVVKSKSATALLASMTVTGGE